MLCICYKCRIQSCSNINLKLWLKIANPLQLRCCVRFESNVCLQNHGPCLSGINFHFLIHIDEEDSEFVAVMLKVLLEILSFPHSAIDHVANKFGKSTKLTLSGRGWTIYKQTTFCQYLMSHKQHQLHLYSATLEGWHFGLNYKSEVDVFSKHQVGCVSKSAPWKYIKTNVRVYFR